MAILFVCLFVPWVYMGHKQAPLLQVPSVGSLRWGQGPVSVSHLLAPSLGCLCPELPPPQWRWKSSPPLGWVTFPDSPSTPRSTLRHLLLEHSIF